MKRAVLVALALAACSRAAPVVSRPSTARVEIAQGAKRMSLHVEIADDATERARGLMGRTSIPAGTGMLFVYPDARAWGGYWMKDTLVALDIAFVRRGVITEIHTMQPCLSATCPLTTPSDAYDEALEVAAGGYAAAGISPGATVAIRSQGP